MASPSVLFFALPWLMVLMIWGTVAQKDLGLYRAHELYFSSWIVWAWFVPLPGAYPILGAITLCLLTKFLFFSAWRVARTGTIIAHLGILVLMVGSLLTAMTQKEGFVMLRAGQETDQVSDYHARVLTIEKNGEAFQVLPFAQLRADTDLPLGHARFYIRKTCTNCRPVGVKHAEGRRGLAAQISLEDAPPEKENEANLSGLTFDISGADPDSNGLYVLMEEIPHRPEISIGKDIYKISIGRAQSSLPFTIALEKFERDMHPGTDVARGFLSNVVVKKNGVTWPYTIRMNEPLRYKGYTFYQSSFSIKPDGEYSILSVVENKGRTFPYLASALIFAGLLAHVVLRVRQRSVKSTL